MRSVIKQSRARCAPLHALHAAQPTTMKPTSSAAGENSTISQRHGPWRDILVSRLHAGCGLAMP